MYRVKSLTSGGTRVYLEPKSILKAEKQFETPGARYVNCSHPEIDILRLFIDTTKSAGQVKKRQDFDWFPLATCCCSTIMYDRLKYLELCDIYHKSNNNNNNNHFLKVPQLFSLLVMYY